MRERRFRSKCRPRERSGRVPDRLAGGGSPYHLPVSLLECSDKPERTGPGGHGNSIDNRGGVGLDRAVAILYGIVCHALFTIGVATMIAAMFYGMSRSLGRVAPPWSFIANAGLLLQFPLGHSLLLSGGGRRVPAGLRLGRWAARMSTTTYVIVASLQVFLLFAFWTPSGTVWWRAEGVRLWALSCPLRDRLVLLLKAIWDAGLALQTGFLGWWAIFRIARRCFRRCRQPDCSASCGNRSTSPSP